MRSRSSLAILVIGLLGLTILGFLVKFALDSNPDLQKIILFKTAFAKDFEGEGFRDVSVVRRKQGGGYRMVLMGERREGGLDAAALDERIATYFIEHFPDRSAALLEIAYADRPSMGCAAEGSPYRSQEIALGPMRTRVAFREQRKALSQRLVESFDVRLVDDRRDGRTLYVELEAPPSPADELRRLALKVEPVVRDHFIRVEFYATLNLRLRSRGAATGSPGAQPVEVRFDPRGRELGG